MNYLPKFLCSFFLKNLLNIFEAYFFLLFRELFSVYFFKTVFVQMCHADDNLRDREKHCVTFGDYNQFFSVGKSLFTRRGNHLNFKRASYLGAHSILVNNVITASNSTRLSILSGNFNIFLWFFWFTIWSSNFQNWTFLIIFELNDLWTVFWEFCKLSDILLFELLLTFFGHFSELFYLNFFELFVWTFFLELFSELFVLIFSLNFFLWTFFWTFFLLFSLNFFPELFFELFSLYYFISGHDVSIEAILTTLGILRVDHVPYASRLIFERWRAQFRPEFGPDIYFRILLNGEPIRIENLKSEKAEFDDFPMESFYLIKMDYFIQFLSEKLNQLFFLKNPFEENIYNTICSRSYIENLLLNS